MDNDLTLRSIGSGDLAFLARVYRDTRQEEMAQSGWTQEQIDDFLEFQFQAQHKFYQEQFAGADFDLVLCKGEAVGRLYVSRREDEIRIIDIALLTEHRRKGIGGRLLRKILAEAVTVGLPVRIHVEMNNPALNLYHHLGFCRTGDTGVYYLMEWRPDKKDQKAGSASSSSPSA